MTCLRFLLTGILVQLFFKVQAQKSVEEQNQIWVGYMTSTRLSPRYSWWNDTHLVPNGFFVLRTGLTRNFQPASITAGYAYLLLPLSAENQSLKRKEHRPWAQIQATFPLPNGLSVSNRIRYDARFRQIVDDGELSNHYSFVNRLRFLISIRKAIRVPEEALWKPFVSLNEEILVNFGRQVSYNSFDQNRISLMVGASRGNMQIQAGYMSRFVQVAPQSFINNRTLVIWVTHRIGESAKPRHEDNVTE